MVTAPAFLTARVMHKRLLPRVHAFNYGVFYLCFPLLQVEKLKNTFLSVERWNLLSFYRRDHGMRDGSDLNAWIRKILADHAITNCDGDIVLITMPRVLGYVFNPVSFWLCHDADGQLRAVLSEVNNTFGESHCYLSYHDDLHPIGNNDWFEARKLFHVSPFLDVSGRYKFRFAVSGGHIAIHINLFDGDELKLSTSVTGSSAPVSSTQTLRMLATYPLLTFKAIALIHFEAFRLLLKGMKYHPKPPPPAEQVTR